MKVARIVAPFGLAAVLFILSYLSSREPNSGIFPIMLLVIGIIVAIIGFGVLFSNPDK